MNNWYTVTKNYSRCPYLNNVTLNLIHNILTSKKITSQTFFRQIYTLILYKGRFLFHFCLPVKKNSISISKAEVSLVHSHEVVISYDPVLVVIFSDISLKSWKKKTKKQHSHQIISYTVKSFYWWLTVFIDKLKKKLLMVIKFFNLHRRETVDHCIFK